MYQVLVVSNDRAGLSGILRVLQDGGYQATGASTFEHAKRLLAHLSPDIVFADERLGAFNGLHLLLTARAQHPYVSAVVTTPVKRPGLDADARTLKVECMVKPQNPAEW